MFSWILAGSHLNVVKSQIRKYNKFVLKDVKKNNNEVNLNEDQKHVSFVYVDDIMDYVFIILFSTRNWSKRNKIIRMSIILSIHKASPLLRPL